jgi:hypothetical protein
MSNKLESYLEEISHFLSGRREREEVVSEIRSHILEKAEQESGTATDAAIDAVIEAYGSPRRVAEKYLDGQEIIAPAFRRYLFRYTTILFGAHTLATIAAFVWKTSFYIFPLFFVPRLNIVEALMYWPTAFLGDLGVVTLVLFLISRSGKEIRLPWPRFGLDLDEIRPRRHLIPDILGIIALSALIAAGLYFYFRYGSIFFVNLNFHRAKPLFTPQAGRWLSLALIGLWVVEDVRLLVKLFRPSAWLNLAKDAISLVLVGLLFRWPVDSAFAVPVPEALRPYLKPAFVVFLALVALSLAVDFIKSLIVIGRSGLAKA